MDLRALNELWRRLWSLPAPELVPLMALVAVTLLAVVILLYVAARAAVDALKARHHRSAERKQRMRRTEPH